MTLVQRLGGFVSKSLLAHTKSSPSSNFVVSDQVAMKLDLDVCHIKRCVLCKANHDYGSKVKVTVTIFVILWHIPGNFAIHGQIWMNRCTPYQFSLLPAKITTLGQRLKSQLPLENPCQPITTASDWDEI